MKETSILEEIMNAVFAKQKKIMSMAQQNSKDIEIVNKAISVINLPQYMKKLSISQAYALFNYLDFPKNRWEEMYYKALFETVNNEKYQYINPEDLRRYTR